MHETNQSRIKKRRYFLDNFYLKVRHGVRGMSPGVRNNFDVE